MSKDSSKKSGANKQASISDWNSEQILQAVILIDSYNSHFIPLTNDTPFCLIPVANEPLLSYTLYYLKNSGIQKIIIVSKTTSQQLKTFISDHPSLHNTSQLSVQLVFSEKCETVGDCLRELYSRQLIATEFILLLGCVVSNWDFRPILEEHQIRAKNNKGVIMTMTFKKCSPDHESRTQESDLTIMTSKTEKQLLYYEKCGYKKKFSFPIDKIKHNAPVKIHYNLQETSLYFCSPQVPQLFCDNFDYQTIEDFIHGLLVHEELMGNQIFTHIIDSKSYIGCPDTPLLYYCVSTNIMERWSFPFVPDTNLDIYNNNLYEYTRRDVYLSNEVTLEIGCRLQQNVVIGKHCHINTGAYITRSVLGPNVLVGKDSRIEDSFIWGNCIIEDNCSIQGCIVAYGVNIAHHCILNSGCLISNNVKLGANVTLPSCSRITLNTASLTISPSLPDSSPLSFGNFSSISSAAEVFASSSLFCKSSDIDLGEGGSGVRVELYYSRTNELYQPSYENIWGRNRPEITIPSLPETPNSSIYDPEDVLEPPEGADNLQEENTFYPEFLDIIRHGLSHNSSLDDIHMEIKSIRTAYEIPPSDVSPFLLQAILEGPTNTPKGATGLLEYAKTAVANIKSIFSTFIKSELDQVALLEKLELIALSDKKVQVILPHILLLLFENKIVSEKAILDWHSSILSYHDSEAQKKTRDLANTVVEWLQTPETDSDVSD